MQHDSIISVDCTVYVAASRTSTDRVCAGEQPDVELESPLRGVPVEAEREHGRLQRGHDAHEGGARVVERVLVAQLRLHDDPERVEEAAADAQQRPHGVVGGGRGVHVPVQVVVVVALGECGDQVQVAVSGRDVHALVEGEQHGPADAQQGPRDLGLAGEGADVESLVAEGEGDDEGPRREEVRCRGGESGRGELHAGNVQVLRHRAPACMRGCTTTSERAS